METTLRKYAGKYLGSFTSKDMDAAGYGNGAGWEASMMKLEALRQVVSKKKVKDEDWVLSIDSDVVFCNSGVFDYLKTLDLLTYTKAEIVGIHQGPPLAQCKMGDLHNFSGCSIYIKGNIARNMAAIPVERLTEVRQEFKDYVLTENEDIVLSYLAQMLGAAPMPLPEHLYHSEEGFAKDIVSGDLCSFYHLNYPTEYFHGSFLGVPITGKWDIPKALNKRKIIL
jgi:hypothetical protein